jgi:hypothetical protein
MLIKTPAKTVQIKTLKTTAVLQRFYSGSTAWHNSARSRLFMVRNKDGTLTLDHQKNNLGLCHEQITLV